jgi:hypothetical protein
MFVTDNPANYPSDWFARNATGGLIQDNMYGNYLMDPTSAGWTAHQVAACQQLIASSGYDGCFLDNVGPAPVKPPFTYTTTPPFNAATGATWTVADWMSAMTTFAASIQTALGTHPVVGNSLGGGDDYFTYGTSTLLSGIAGAQAEGFLRTGRSALTPYPTPFIWKENVDMVADAGARGKTLLVVTKTWNTGTTEQKDAWHLFSLASFLLGTDGTAKYFFTEDLATPVVDPNPMWNPNVGRPLAPYKAIKGGLVYVRTFTRAKVWVNPSSTPVTINLPKPMTTLAGDVVTSINLAPDTAQIVVH